MRIITGIQPSGRIHLGNYLSAIKPILDLQKDNKVFVFIADLHSLTSTKNANILRQNALDLAIDLIALGVDPNKTCLFLQSSVPQVAELSWYLGNLLSVSTLERAHAYKDKIDNGLPSNVGLFTYPVLMAADILIYGADAVPVGKDQIQHLEIARDLAMKFNVIYSQGFDPKTKKSDFFKLKMPEPIITCDIVLGTDGRKMSKTYQNTIDIFADDKVVEKQIKGIKTNSLSVENPKDKDCALYSLISYFANPSDMEILNKSFEAGGLGYGYYKNQLLELFHLHFDEARNKRKEIDILYVKDMLKYNAYYAKSEAFFTLNEVRNLVGVGL